MEENQIIINSSQQAVIKEVINHPWVIEDGTWDDNKYWVDSKTWSE